MDSTTNQANGKVIFSGIHQLPDHWWSDPTIDVWKTWDINTYYLWGANQSNYNLAQGRSLMGAGMAGTHGPTRGYAHDHYIGLDTMDYSDTRNPGVFTTLEGYLLQGKNIVVPIYHGCFSLGTGIGGTAMDWNKIQLQMFQKLLALMEKASTLEIPPHTFWPDCRVLVAPPNDPAVPCSICLEPTRSNLNVHSHGVVEIKGISDIESIISMLT